MSSTDPKTKKILVVDDDKMLCAFFRNLLALDGFQVVPTLGWEQAKKILESGDPLPDLVLLDLMMPKQGGYEILKDLQQDIYRHIPIVVATARILDPDLTAMIRNESNVKALFSKPVTTTVFKNRIHELLGTKPTGIKPDNFEWMEKFGDPGFQYHATAVKLQGLAALRLSGADILPFDYSDCASEVINYIGPSSAILLERPEGGHVRIGALAENGSLPLSELMARGWHGAA